MADNVGQDKDHAGELTVGTPVAGEIDTAGDRDWYEVSLTANRTYTFDLSGIGAGAGDTLANPELRLLASNGTTVLAADSNSGPGSDARITFFTATGGTFYLDAHDFANATGTFTLRAALTQDTVPGNTGSTVTVAAPGSVTGVIDTANDSDWYKVSLTAGSVYRFTVTSNGGVPDPQLRVRNSNGTEIVASDADTSANSESLLFRAPTAGDYFIDVKSSDRGLYTLTTATATGDAVPGGPTTTSTLGVGGFVIGSIDYANNDRDWYKIELTGGQAYRFDLSGGNTVPGITTLPDPLLRLIGPDGEEVLASNDNRISGSVDSFLLYHIGTTGTYYLAAQSAPQEDAANATGTYLLQATAVGPADDVPDVDGAETRVVKVNGPAFNGRLDATNDVDVFHVKLEAGQTYVFTAVGTASSPDVDLQLFIPGPHGADQVGQYISPSSSPAIFNAHLAFTAPQDMTLAVGVRSEDGLGSYNFSVDEVSQPNAVTALTDALRWNADKPLGTGITITYSFMTGLPEGFNLPTGDTFESLRTPEKAAVREALDLISDFANVKFVEAAAGAEGQLRFGAHTHDNDDPDKNFSLWQTVVGTGSTANQVFGLRIVSDTFQFDGNAPAPGSLDYLSLIGLLTDAVGVQGRFLGGVSAALPPVFNSTQYTMMANTGKESSEVFPMTPMLLDIAALQRLYGANPDTEKGNTVYEFSRTAEQLRTIYDAGGTDTFDAGNHTRDLVINLNAGVFNSIGVRKDGNVTEDAQDNVVIAFGTVIENATGGSGDDSITGNSKNNVLKGGGGADTLAGGAGNDTLDGGSGADTASYAHAGKAVTVDLGKSTQSTGGAGTDKLTNIENVTGSEFNDKLTGRNSTDSSGNNVLSGRAGNDTLDGRAGNDTLDGGAGTDTLEGGSGNDKLDGSTGNDTLDGGTGNDTIAGGAGNDAFDGGAGNDTLNGGAGNDTVSYADATAAVTVSLAINGAQNLGSAGNDVLTAVENLIGSDFNDTLTGNTANNVLNGGAGNDTLTAGAGNDTLDGGSGNDALDGGAGNDTYVVGSASDTVTEGADGGTDLVRSGVSYTLLANQENLTLTGSGNLNGTGNTLDNVLTGNRGRNSLGGGEGNDTLIDAAGNDTLAGDAGIDTVSYAGASAGVTVSLNDAGAQNTGGAGNDTITGFENLTGSAFSDVLTGTAEANTLNGGKGNDTLDGGGGTDTASYAGATAGVKVSLALAANAQQNTGGAGTDRLTGFENLTGSKFNDTLTGSNGANALKGDAGNDTLIGGTGSDALDGGAGTDTVSYAGAGAVTVSLAVTAAQNTGGAGTDTLASVENLTGGGNNDTLTGDGGKNVLDGGGGADELAGGGGNDTYVVNSSGDDITEAADGGTDSVQSTATSYTLSDYVERLTLGGSGNINGAGSAQDNVVTGNGGNNSLSGNDGNDTLTGGKGNDTLNGGDGNDTLIDNDGTDTLNGGDGNDTLSSGAGNETLNGGSGDDVLNGGSGNDSLIGSSGSDTASYAGATAAVTVKVSVTARQNTGGGGNDILSSIENLIGTDFNDTLTGDDGSNTLNGGKGNDALTGGSGSDTASYAGITAGVKVSLALTPAQNTGGGGVDTLTGFENLTGGEGNDELTGTAARNVLDGGAGTDKLIGGAGNDTYGVSVAQDVVTEVAGGGTDLAQSTAAAYSLAAEVENLTLLGSGNISGTGNALANVLTGNSGNNLLDGGAANDTVNGGAGNDTLTGGAGNDTLAGGSGNDTYVLDVAADVVTEGSNAGTDTVLSPFNYSLETRLTLENLTLTGTALTGTGNTRNNVLTGNALGNTLFGRAGNDTLNGGAGNDTLEGGAGNDTYVVDSTLDGVGEDPGEGTDLVQSTANNFTLAGEVENLTLLGSLNINGTGNLLANVLTGNAGNNVLDGGGGALADTLIGGAGNDTYVVNVLEDVVTEGSETGSGTDLVRSSISYTLEPLANVENLELTGSANLDGTGNALANVLTGNSGTNTLAGGAGNDTYVVNTGDVVTEEADAGTDLVQSSVTYSLTANVENLTLTGSAGISGTGNALVNVLTGNSGANTLDGGGEADTLAGGAGNDTYLVDVAGDVVSEGSNAGTDLVQSAVSHSLAANVENLSLAGSADLNGTGNALNNALVGNSGTNTLDAGAGDDGLDGGAGNDILIGGAGNDFYVVDSAQDVVTEGAGTGSGTDLVRSSAADYTLSENVENLELFGSGNINGTGNTLANLLTGNSGNNTLDAGDGDDTLDGGLGNDTLIGGAGNDNYTVNATTDAITEGAGAGSGIDHVDSTASSYSLSANVENLSLIGTNNINGAGNALANVLTGNIGNNVLGGGGEADTITGGAGNDTLDGGTENDTLVGGAGNDTYVVDTAQDTVTEEAGAGSGTDLVQSTAASYSLSGNVENLTLLGGGNINGTGNALANVLTGNSGENSLDGGDGDDTLNGGSGNDTLVGGADDDTYVVDASADVVTEGANAGTDLVQSTATSYSLSENVENLTLTGSGNINGTGNALANVLTGNGGINVLDGGEGNDTFLGGAGNDTYAVDVTADAVTEGSGAGSGADLVQSVAGSYTLTDNVEDLTLLGIGSIDGTGNGLDNVLTGNAGHNTLNGAGGNDLIKGLVGTDFLTGGAGADVFDYDALADSGTDETTRDTIADFNTGEDTIDLSGIDANEVLVGNDEFTFIGTAEFDADATGQLRFDAANHLLLGSTDADGAAEFSILLNGVNTLVAGDFIL